MKTVLAIVITIIFIAVMMYLIITDNTTYAPALLAIGMLGDPFKTSRKLTVEKATKNTITVPRRIYAHSRVGHRERTFRSFAKWSLIVLGGLCFLGMLLGYLATLP